MDLLLTSSEAALTHNLIVLFLGRYLLSMRCCHPSRCESDLIGCEGLSKPSLDTSSAHTRYFAPALRFCLGLSLRARIRHQQSKSHDAERNNDEKKGCTSVRKGRMEATHRHPLYAQTRR